VPVRYVPYPDDVPLPEIERQVREVVERVARDGEVLRRRAAEAWLPSFHDECPEARGWDSDRLAGTFTLRGIILGNSHPTFILEYETTLPVESHPSTWFSSRRLGIPRQWAPGLIAAYADATDQSSLMPASRTAAPHLACSVRMKAANCSGVPPSGVLPSS
jgi:hypothetical protein